MLSRRSRKIWVQVHLWLGLLFGSWFVVEGLTGSLLAFDYELDVWLHPALSGSCSEGSWFLPLDRLLDVARSATSSELTRISIPHGKGVARVYAVGAGAPEIAVDRCTGRVLMVRDFDSSLIGIAYRIHANLMMGEGGRTLVGVSGLLLCLSIVSGLALWWPRKRGVLHALKIKRGASRFRFFWDLHKAVGAVGGIPLALIVITGTCAAFPEALRATANVVFSLDARFPAPPTGKPPGLQQSVDAAIGAIPDGTLMGVKIPKPEQATVTVRLRRPWEPMKYSGQTRVMVGEGGSVLAIRDANRMPAASQVLDWIFPLHTGEAFSIPGRACVGFLGALPPLLLATGLVIWTYKRRTRSLATNT